MIVQVVIALVVVFVGVALMLTLLTGIAGK